MTKKINKKYLDLTLLKAGDVILTSEKTFVSRTLIILQRVLHFNFKSPGFSHAILSINPVVTFDTQGKSGARFRCLSPDKISEHDGRVKIWHDISTYKNFSVMRYADSICPTVLLESALKENTRKYSSPFGFLSLAHPAIKSVFHNFTRGKYSQKHQEKFCSSLTTELLTSVANIEFLRKNAPGEISPFKLFSKKYEVTGITKSLPDVFFKEEPLHLSFLSLISTITGHWNLGDPDEVQHALEDIVKAAAVGSLLKNVLASEPSFYVEKDGASVSIIENPNLAQYESIKSRFDGSADFFRRLEEINNCYSGCSSCNSPLSCSRDLKNQLQRIAHEISIENSDAIPTIVQILQVPKGHGQSQGVDTSGTAA